MNRRHDEEAGPNLTEAAQGYLLALRAITDGGATALTSALARELGVSTQAASEMIGRLAGDGLVRVSEDRELSLTEPGRAAADTIFRRHSLMEWLLTQVVGLGWAESDEEAMRLQGAVSPRVEAAVATLLGDPPTCPHGNPISAEASRTRPRGVPLSEVKAGEDITIYRITERAEEDKELLHYLEEQALVPGAQASVVEVSVGLDALTLEGPRGRSSMGLRPASLIRVLPGQADPALFHKVPAGVGRATLAPSPPPETRRAPAAGRAPR
ncbi:MAG TPA: metal-dependent transcriptional regulator [Candidatus Limnocylindrales bacterium]|nr:metal-dependent transcriptional regulator [Candidatus Limnocylindrales bacterium]